jgi:TetR/AcrR family transcriptional repressor of lmrAB and yxaGH operons
VSARDQILATTCALLEAQGYHATGLNQIIHDSGSPKGSLYYYFPGGKEELALEAITQAGSMIRQRIRENLADAADPVEAIRSFIWRIAQQVELSGFRAGGPITTIAMEAASTNERLRGQCHQIYEGWQQEFAQKLMQSGIAEERARRLAVIIIAAIEGGIILCRTSQSRLPLENVAEEIALLLATSL